MGSWPGEVKRGLKILFFYVFLPLFLAPSCKPGNSSSNAAVLVPPSGFTATAITTTRVDLAWAGVPADATSIEIEVSVNGGAFAPLVTLPAAATAYSSTGLTGSTEYCYRVRSVNPGAQGAWSATVCASTIIVTQISPIPDPANGSPSARMGHSAVYDSFHDWMVIFGGLAATGGPSVFTNQLWILDFSVTPAAWTQLSLPSPPTPRARHSAIYDAAFRRMIVYGGDDGTASSPLDEVWVLDLSTASPSWSLFTPLTPVGIGRSLHSAVYDSASQRMVVFGGDDGGGGLGDVLQMDLTAALSDWGPPLPTHPSLILESHAAVYDSVLQQMIVFGGNDSGAGATPYSNETWSLTLSGTPAWTQLSPTTPPSERENVAGIYNPSTRSMAVFGGSDLSGPYAELQKLMLQGPPACSIVPSSGPAARIGHSLIFIPAGGRMILFGGGTPPMTPSFFDVWQFEI